MIERYSPVFQEIRLDRLGDMRLFITIADAGSLSAAGRRRGMPLTTVSRRLAALEEQLGARLVTRTTRRLTLTDQGRRYLDACRRIVEDVEAAETWLSGDESEPTGELAITAPVVFGRLYVLPIVTAFLRASTRVEARLLLLDRSVDLIEEDLDVAIRIGVLPDSSLVATRVGAVRRVFCASPRYIKQRGMPNALEDLADHDCVVFSALGQADQWIVSDGRKQRRVQVRSRLFVNTAEAAIDAAIAGLGVTRVLSYQASRAFANGSLIPILVDFDRAEQPVSIVHRERRLPRPKVRSFVDFAAERLRKRLA